ncbi:MAG: hypothetical protein ACYC1R_01565 [Coriobacteriia bacterium]
MSETAMTAPAIEDAERLLRHVAPQEALEAGILTPMAGTRPVRLFSLEEVESFLTVYDRSVVDVAGQWAQVNYVDLKHLAAWIGDTLGDRELAVAVSAIAASREAYGFLVPDVKSLIAAQIGQAKAVLSAAEAPAG